MDEPFFVQLDPTLVETYLESSCFPFSISTIRNVKSNLVEAIDNDLVSTIVNGFYDPFFPLMFPSYYSDLTTVN